MVDKTKYDEVVLSASCKGCENCNFDQKKI